LKISKMLVFKRFLRQHSLALCRPRDSIRNPRPKPSGASGAQGGLAAGVGYPLPPKFLVFIRIAGIFAQAIEGKGDQGKIVKTRELDVSCGKGTVWNQGLSGTSPVKSSTLWG